MTSLHSPPARTRIRVAYPELLAFTRAVFAAHGVAAGRARLAANALCHGDLAGMASHGLANLTGLYLPLLRSGRARADVQPLVIADRGAALLVDARHGLGLWAASEAMDLAAARAERYGVGLVSVRGGTHFGCAGYHAARAVRHGMIGVVAANCGHQRLAAPPGGLLPLFGTNPLSVAAPAGDNPPFILDMSTTAVPTGKVRAAARAGEQVPPGWLADEQGRPVTDPAAFDRGDARLLWLGGPGQGEHKGFGLGVLVEVLAALLSGSGLGPVPDALVGAEPPADDDIGYFVLAVAPATLRGQESYRRDAGAMFETVLGCPSALPDGHVGYPGWPEAQHAERCFAEGVPLDQGLYRELSCLADSLGIGMPEPVP